MKISTITDTIVKMFFWIVMSIFSLSVGFAAEEAIPSSRAAKSLAYFSESYLDAPPVILDGAADEYSDYTEQFVDYSGEFGSNDLSSRARPGSRPKPDSPVYYIRLPPTPYMLVPGVGYVSRPPTLRPPPVVQTQPTSSQFINLPVKFVSNAKPTGVYTWKPDSPVTQLDKGPYIFNGRPTDIFLLRNTYNALYDEGLQNFYP